MTRRVMGGALPALIVTGGLVLAALLAVLVVAGGGLLGDDQQASTYLVSGRADVPAGQVQDDVFVLRGRVTVDGAVDGDVVVLDGVARIRGAVRGEVTVLRGGLVLGPDAEVSGDVHTLDATQVDRAEGATVGGVDETLNPLQVPDLVPDTAWFVLWLAGGLAVLAVGLLLPKPPADAAIPATANPVRSILLGLCLLVLAPVAVAVLSLSLVGLGLAVVLAGTVAVASALAAATTAVAVGGLVRLPEGRTRFLAGWAALGVAMALAVLASPLVAALAGAVVVAFGLGAFLPARRPAAADPQAGDPYDGIDDEDRALLNVFDRLGDEEPAAVTEPADEEPEPKILASFPIGQ